MSVVIKTVTDVDQIYAKQLVDFTIDTDNAAAKYRTRTFTISVKVQDASNQALGEYKRKIIYTNPCDNPSLLNDVPAQVLSYTYVLGSPNVIENNIGALFTDTASQDQGTAQGYEYCNSARTYQLN